MRSERAAYQCPAVKKPEVIHVSRENAIFVPIKPKVVFRVFKPMECETSLFSRFSYTIKTVFVLINTVVYSDTWYNNNHT